MIKRIAIFILLVSLAFNTYFLIRKIDRVHRMNEYEKLHYYKDISYKEGYDYFINQLEKKYPETLLSNKVYVVYMWDSTLYDFMNKPQMKALDSMATFYGKYKLEYIFATEMEENASMGFLKRSGDDYKNVKMLYDMDDYISSLYSNKDFKLSKAKYGVISADEEKKEEMLKMLSMSKRKGIYVIMAEDGKILYNNQNQKWVLKDSLFLNKLKSIVPAQSLKILN